MKFTQDSASHHILLSSDRLQETRFRWSRLAREYMDSKPDEFPLTDSLSDFALELGAFHDWLRDRYWDEHRALTEGYEASVAEYYFDESTVRRPCGQGSDGSALASREPSCPLPRMTSLSRERHRTGPPGRSTVNRPRPWGFHRSWPGFRGL